jgi:hypothetical protein
MTTMTTMSTTDTTTLPPAPRRLDRRQVLRTMAKRSYCTLATVSSAGRPHVAGVLYEIVGDRMYVTMSADSRKARNIEHRGDVAVVVPVRRLPVGAPPSAVQFQATAELVAADDPAIAELLAAGELGSITGHGELDVPGVCFVRIDLPRRLHTYGLGMSLVTLARDPLGAGGVADDRDPLGAGGVADDRDPLTAGGVADDRDPLTTG